MISFLCAAAVLAAAVVRTPAAVGADGEETFRADESDRREYTSVPLAECVECRDGQTWKDRPCCTGEFEKDCAAKKGVVRSRDLHPLFTVLKGCFRRAPDAGKACASAADCLSGVCDLKNAVVHQRCELTERKLTGGKDPNSGKPYYEATYSCMTERPGACAETIEDMPNPAGVSHVLGMRGRTLVEQWQSGPVF